MFIYFPESNNGAEVFTCESQRATDALRSGCQRFNTKAKTGINIYQG